MDKITDHYRAPQQRELSDASNGNTSTDLNLPTEVCTGTAKTKEQSQRRAFNLIPIMVSSDRPTYKDRHAAELIMARRDVLHSKAEYIAADLSLAPKLSLAVLRRTIHYRLLIEVSRKNVPQEMVFPVQHARGLARFCSAWIADEVPGCFKGLDLKEEEHFAWVVDTCPYLF